MADDVSKLVKAILTDALQLQHKLDDLLKAASQDKALAPLTKTAATGYTQFHKTMRELLKKTS